MTSCNTGSGQCPPGGTVQRCCPRREVRPVRCDLLFCRIASSRLTPDVLDGAFCIFLMPLGLLSHRSLLIGDDEPKTLPYAISLNCSIGAEGEHFWNIFGPNVRFAAPGTPVSNVMDWDRSKMPSRLAEKPASMEDRAVPGHWEGDLIGGSKNSYIATLVERQSRYVMLVKVANKDTESVISALIKQSQRLPKELYKIPDLGSWQRAGRSSTPDNGDRCRGVFLRSSHLGNAGQTKIPTVCSDSTCRAEPICRCIPRQS